MTPRVRSNWANPILVCAKCSKKLGGGFGRNGRKPLAKALRKHLGLKKNRKARAGVIEVKCLGVCPKRAVTMIDTARPGEWLIVPEGADLGELAGELGLAPGKTVESAP